MRGINHIEVEVEVEIEIEIDVERGQDEEDEAHTILDPELVAPRALLVVRGTAATYWSDAVTCEKQCVSISTCSLVRGSWHQRVRNGGIHRVSGRSGSSVEGEPISKLGRERERLGHLATLLMALSLRTHVPRVIRGTCVWGNPG